ncbi:hypothetical protein DY000_02060952 [Brassica cretica]|uniref:Uncharacterized protein n=1 Tax=Brassica cretica TaxID=69181 RepID=A0ABQ7AYU8_BRACR|nr:hypothetical protein DY000_02060952 [Brassica cretica]
MGSSTTSGSLDDPKVLAQPPVTYFDPNIDDALEPMLVDQTSERRTLRRRKEKVPKHLKRGTKETEQDIHRIFYQIREKMKQRITMKKKSDPRKFAVPCLVNGIKFPCAVLHRFISQHTTQGNGRTSRSEDRAFGGFIHFCGPFYENSKESSEILRCRLAMH